MKTCQTCERSYIYYENRSYPGKSLKRCPECELEYLVKIDLSNPIKLPKNKDEVNN